MTRYFNVNSSHSLEHTSNFKNNLVRVHFTKSNFACDSLIDTRSAVNVISETTLDRILRSQQNEILPSTSLLRSVANTPTILMGKVELTFQVAGQTTDDFSYISENTNHNLILGVIFFKLSTATIKYEKMQMALPTGTWDVQTLAKIKLAPRSSRMEATGYSTGHMAKTAEGPGHASYECNEEVPTQ